MCVQAPSTCLDAQLVPKLLVALLYQDILSLYCAITGHMHILLINKRLTVNCDSDATPIGW